MPRKRKLTYETENDIFPTRLRGLMEETKTTQTKLASVLKIKHETISYYASGQSKPNYEVLGRIADYFNVSADYLLGRSDVRTLNIDVQAVCSYTGLSEEAVSNLRKMSLLPSFSPDDTDSLSFTMDKLLSEKAIEISNVFHDTYRTVCKGILELTILCQHLEEGIAFDMDNKKLIPEAFLQIKEIERDLGYSLYNCSGSTRDISNDLFGIVDFSKAIEQLHYDPDKDAEGIVSKIHNIISQFKEAATHGEHKKI